MKQAILSCLILAVLALTASSMRTEKMRTFLGAKNDLKYIQSQVLHVLDKSDNEFINEVKLLVEISLGEGRYDEVMRVMSSLWDTLNGELNSENKLYIANRAAFQDAIKTFLAAREAAEAEQKTQNKIFKTNRDAVKTLTRELLILKPVLAAQKASLAKLRGQWAADVKAFNARQSAHKGKQEIM
jgi:hypothetical protein